MAAANGDCYYDSNDIFAEETLIPTVFQTGAIGIGRVLDPANNSVDLKAGTKTDIPFWMLNSLKDRGMVQLLMPKCYGKRLREKVQAGAQFVDLRKACPYFYDFGMKFSQTVVDEEFAGFLVNTFRVRYMELLTKSQSHNPNNASGELTKLRSLLSYEEQQIFEAGCECMASIDRWRYKENITGQKRKLHIGT